MIEPSGFFAGLGGAAMVQAIAIMLARRWLGRVDSMEADLKDLRGKEMAKIERQLEGAAQSRRGIHERIAQIERDMVKRGDLDEIHNRHLSQVKELAEVATRIEVVSRHVEDQVSRIASVTADVNRIIGRLEKR